MATHSSTLAWKIPWTEEAGGLQSMGLHKVGHDWVISLSHFTFMHWRRKWQPTPVFLPGESQGRGVWWAAVYGVAQSLTRLKRLGSSSRLNLGVIPILVLFYHIIQLVFQDTSTFTIYPEMNCFVQFCFYLFHQYCPSSLFFTRIIRTFYIDLLQSVDDSADRMILLKPSHKMSFLHKNPPEVSHHMLRMAHLPSPWFLHASELIPYTLPSLCFNHTDPLLHLEQNKHTHLSYPKRL